MTCTTTIEQSELVEAIARRVAELLAAAPAPQLVDAATLARMFGISRATVYEHAGQFGAVRLPVGGRQMVRFDVETARAAWTSCGTSESSHTADMPAIPSDDRLSVRQPRRRRRAAARSSDGLLPVRGG